MRGSLSRLKKKTRRAVIAFRNEPAKKVAEPRAIQNLILIGTHHKTGTVWLIRIFAKLCKQYGLNYTRGQITEIPADCDVFHQVHSSYTLNAIDRPFKGVHIIRDPRDRIISGVFYHLKSDELWLHVKDEQYDGMTYQEKLRSFPSLSEQIMFEMENSAHRDILDMIKWDYTNEHFIDVKFEDLMADNDLILFHEIFSFLGIKGHAIPTALSIAWRNSLFSGKVKYSAHIRSGKPREWAEYFTNDHKARFVELFGDALIHLGYEDNNDWASE
jgi:Sulfotransferase domain